jgi:glycosyltransferase 2 family protein
MTHAIRRWLPWLAKALLSVGVVWYVLSRSDVTAIWRQLQAANWVWLVAALATQLLQAPIGGRRWQVVVLAIGGRLSLLRCTFIFYVSSFFNLVLPGAVGADGVRMWEGHRYGLPLTQAVSSVVLERAGTLFGLLALAAAMTPALVSRIGPALPAPWLFPLLCVIGALGLVAMTQLDRLPREWSHWRVVRGLFTLSGDARKVFLRPRPAIELLIWAVVGHINLAVVVWMLARALSVNVSMIDCLELMPPVILATILPVSIAGWGVREGAMVAAFHLIGVTSEAALAMSILSGVSVTVASFPAGVIWFMSSGRRPAADPRNEINSLA